MKYNIPESTAHVELLQRVYEGTADGRAVQLSVSQRSILKGLIANLNDPIIGDDIRRVECLDTKPHEKHIWTMQNRVSFGQSLSQAEVYCRGVVKREPLPASAGDTGKCKQCMRSIGYSSRMGWYHIDSGAVVCSGNSSKTAEPVIEF
jgi:hypothetical protein